MQSYLISGSALARSGTDLIAQIASLPVGEPVPDGWRVLSGNSTQSTIARVAYRFECATAEASTEEQTEAALKLVRIARTDSAIGDWIEERLTAEDSPVDVLEAIGRAAATRDAEAAPAVRRDNVEWHAGKSAHAADKPLNACPYSPGGERAARWELGWRDAEAEAAASDYAPEVTSRKESR